MTELVREDFHEDKEGSHEWVVRYKGWKLLVRQVDGHLEIVIRAELEHDPSPEDWDNAIATLNSFIKRERIGRYRQGPPRNGEPR